LPRKFKIAFSGCENDGDCAVAGIHDVGLIAQVRGNNGTSRRGFKVLVGGRTGKFAHGSRGIDRFSSGRRTACRPSKPSCEFLTETGNRKNKLMARLKFVLRAKGIEEFGAWWRRTQGVASSSRSFHRAHAY